MKEQFVVILEDDHDDIELLEESFREHHTLPVKGFNKPSLFFDFIDSNPPGKIALMVIDLNLPEISGVNVITQLKEKHQYDDFPILVFTTGGTPNEKIFCEKNGIEMFKKPSNVDGWESFAFVMAAHCDPRLARNTL